MTNILPISKTNMSNFQNSNIFIIMATLMGVAIGVMASLAMAGFTTNPAVGAANTSRAVGMRTASVLSSCAAPTGLTAGAASNGGAVLSAAVVAPVQGGRGGDGPSAPSTFVQHLVTGLVATTTVTMSDTGPNSTNKVTTVNKNSVHVENNNNISVSNSNSQTADSGDANVSNNTNAGSATTGHADNWNETETSIEISN